MKATTRKTIRVTHTGSFPFETTRVKRHKLQFVSWIITILLVACDTPAPDPDLIHDEISDYICEGDCLKDNYKYFSGQAIHLEIEPTGEMSQVIYNINPNELKTRPIVLSKSIKISGKAIGADEYLNRGDLEHDNAATFSDIIAIPVTNMIRFLSPRIQPVKASLISTDNASFQLNLFSGIPYTLILNPAGRLDRAPVHINAGIVTKDETMDFEVKTKLVELTGRIVSDDTDLFANQPSPFMHARIMHGSRLVSSVGLVQKDGSFKLEVSNPLFNDPINQSMSLIIEPIDPEVALPRMKIKMEEERLRKNLNVGDINLGTLKKPVSVTFDVHGSDDSNIGNAFLYLRAKIGAGVCFVKKRVNANGKAKFDRLFEGSYDIAVVPPSDSSFAMRVIKAVEFDSTDNVELAIDLQRRKPLDASVLGPTGIPLNGAQLELSRIGEIGTFATEDIYEDNLFKFTAATNEEGKLCHRKFGFNTSNKNECSNLLLDEGHYLAHIIPPAGTELSHKWITFDFPEHNKFSIRIDHPEFLSGQILLPDKKTPARHAFVTVYLAETRMHNQAKVIGTAMTDDNGRFRAFVSAP